MQLTKSNKFFILIFIFTFVVSGNPTSASRIDELRDQISERDQQIKNIEEEIEEYQEEIEKTTKKASSLKNEINRLDITRRKLNSDIYLSQKQIETSALNIERLGIKIASSGKDIESKKSSLAELIRTVYDLESKSLIEITLAHERFSDFFNDLENFEHVQKEINLNLSNLRFLKKMFEKESGEEQAEKEKIERLRGQLVDQKVIVDSNKKNKNNLLTQTKNKESNYKKLLADRLATQKALEDEIRLLEEQIRIEIDPNTLPSTGSGVLKWPIDKVAITQYFGNTKFASENPQIYNWGGHAGVDFRASVGTPIKSSLEGVVVDTGNTDTRNQCPGASYGKWVLIKHPNNLTTLYAHLSLIKVNKGQSVSTGQVIGYSGNTGYTTGPHLHYSVFASKAVCVSGDSDCVTYVSKTCGTELKIPMADRRWYLNPLSYL